MSAPYRGRYAELYDLFYGDKPYTEEAAFVVACLARHGVEAGGRLLDLACGTGRHAVALARAGFEVAGVDRSEDMLARARARAAAAGVALDLRRADMSRPALAAATFDAATCLFDSLGYTVTNDALRRTLAAVYSALRPGGVAIFEVWHAAAMLRHHDPVRVRRWQTEEGEVVRISETALDCARQVATVDFTVYELGFEGGARSHRERHENRYFLARELDGWLEGAGFEARACYGGYGFDRPITTDAWHLLAVARRPDGGAGAR